MSSAPSPRRHPERLQLDFVHETLATAHVHLSHALDLIELGETGSALEHAVWCFVANTKAGVSTFTELKAAEKVRA